LGSEPTGRPALSLGSEPTGRPALSRPSGPMLRAGRRYSRASAGGKPSPKPLLPSRRSQSSSGGCVPLEFLKRGKSRQAAMPAPEPEEIEAEDYSLRIHYWAKSSDGVRMKPHPRATEDLPNMLAGLIDGVIEVVEPLPLEYSEASPVIERPSEAMQWLNAHHELTPITLHALVVLETLDALDLAFDTFACALVDGETDTTGYPLYNALVGGVASHWD